MSKKISKKKLKKLLEEEEYRYQVQIEAKRKQGNKQMEELYYNKWHAIHEIRCYTLNKWFKEV